MEMVLIGLQACKSTLQWEHRWPRIQEHLAEMQTDIVCLQEVNHFDECYGPHMASLGYDGALHPFLTSFLSV
jgi:mRNA deadenylase 3'-5' endonuclease subunit Ccr4